MGFGPQRRSDNEARSSARRWDLAPGKQGHPRAGGIWLGEGGKDGIPGIIKELVTFVQAHDTFQQPSRLVIRQLQ